MWLKIEADLNSEFKVTWGNNQGHYPLSYTVGAQGIRRTADQMRAKLAGLAKSSRLDAAERRLILAQLAATGSQLRYLLFYSPAKQGDIKELQRWIADEYEGGDRELSVQADSSIHVPWGLIFDGELPGPIKDEGPGGGDGASIEAEIERFQGFWSLKYILSATQSGQIRSRAKMTRSRSSFGLLSLVNSEVLAQIRYQIGAAKFAEISELLTPSPVGMAHSVQECRKLIVDAQESDIIFHFLGHHNDVTLDLGNGETIDYVGFLNLIDSLADRVTARGSASCGLIFLNACESAVGDLDMNLRAAAARPEFCGSIATEAIVPRDYAAKFGMSFLSSLIKQGKTIGEILDDLRHDAGLWPESLLYGCYANPHYRIEKA